MRRSFYANAGKAIYYHRACLSYYMRRYRAL